MINSLSLAINVTKQFRHPEVIVSQDVLLQVISTVGETGNGFTQLNLRQDHPKYRYMHRVYWNSIIFIHYSRNELSGSSHAAVSPG
jgi:hypothetical protein